MKPLRNYKDLLKQKESLKSILTIQEEQLQDNVVTKSINKVKEFTQKSPRFTSSLAVSNNPIIENGVELALSTVAAQFFKNKKMGIAAKIAIGVGVVILAKIVANKISERKQLNDWRE